MQIALTGTPDFLLDAISEIAKQRGHSVSRFVPQEPAAILSPVQCDVLIASAIGQLALDPANLVPPGIQPASIALMTQDNQRVPSAPPFAPALTVLTDLPVGPGDPQGTLAYWARRMGPRTKILACGDAARNLARFIDVRDAAEWIVESVEASRKGTFRLRGEEATVGELLETARALAGRDADAQVIYVSDDFLRAHGVDPAQSLPLWSPVIVPPTPANAEGTVEANARVRPLKQTIHDEMKADSARKAPLAAPWLTPRQENELLLEWPHYDPTGEKRRHLRIHIAKVLFGFVLAFAAFVTFVHHNETVEKAVELVQKVDKVALDVLDSFRPAMILDLYNRHAGDIYHAMHGGELHFWPVNVFLLILSLIFATPWVLVGLYQGGGIVNLVGGVLTLSFGIVSWPVLAGIFGFLGRLFPRALPALRENANEHGGIVVGRTILAIAVPAFLYMYDYPPSTTRIVFVVIVCLISLYVVVPLSQDKIAGPEVSILGDNDPMHLLSLAAILVLTLGMGFGISACLKFLLTKAIYDLDWATGQIAAISFLSIFGFLDGVHVFKSLEEEFSHLASLLRLRH